MKSIPASIRKFIGVIAIIMCGFLPVGASADIDIFAKIGDLVGESLDSEFPDYIDVASWEWGSAREILDAARGRGGDKICVEDFTIYKYIDTTSPKLHMAALLGTIFPDAKLRFRAPFGEGVLRVFLEIDLTQVMIRAVKTGGTTEDDLFMETVKLQFKAVKFKYTKFDQQGQNDGSVEFEYEVPSNADTGDCETTGS